MKVQELTSNYSIALSSGVHRITNVVQSPNYKDCCVIHHDGGTFECSKLLKVRRIGQTVFKVAGYQPFGSN